jgi:HSP20 family protein
MACGRLPEPIMKERTMANITRYDPFGDLFDDIFRGFVVGPVGFEAAGSVRRMKIDVAEQNGEYKVLAELPGVKKEDIKVNIDGDEVSITAESRAERDEKDGERVLHSERYFGKVARAFRLNQEIDEARASAKYSDGVLELTLPKKATAAAKQLTIR